MSAGILDVTTGATPATPASGDLRAFGNTSKELSTVDDAGVVKNYLSGKAISIATPADPTGTTNTTGLMAGLAATITPAFSGRVNIEVVGNGTNSGATAGQGVKAQIRYGTGTAPTNAAALTGTTSGSMVTVTLERATADLNAIALVGQASGLTLGTAYWIDVAQAAVTSGTGQLKNLTVRVTEV